jgi:hypothetical protein
VPVLRHRFTAWLHDLRWPVEGALDLAVVMNEAVTNAVDHAHHDRAADDRAADEMAIVDLVAVHAVVDGMSIGPPPDGLRWARVTVRPATAGGAWAPAPPTTLLHPEAVAWCSCAG